MKRKFTNQEYQKLYPTGSNAGRFYGTRKVHKVPENGTINDLPIRLIVSNIGTASYHIAKCHAHLLSPLSQGEFTVKSTKHFMSKVKQMELHESYQIISFDVKPLFTNVPLNGTIDILLRRVYIDSETNTNLMKKELK